jgi:hypothetical protein
MLKSYLCKSLAAVAVLTLFLGLPRVMPPVASAQGPGRSPGSATATKPSPSSRTRLT